MTKLPELTNEDIAKAYALYVIYDYSIAQFDFIIPNGWGSRRASGAIGKMITAGHIKDTGNIWRSCLTETGVALLDARTQAQYRAATAEFLRSHGNKNSR